MLIFNPLFPVEGDQNPYRADIYLFNHCQSPLDPDVSVFICVLNSLNYFILWHFVRLHFVLYTTDYISL